MRAFILLLALLLFMSTPAHAAAATVAAEETQTPVTADEHVILRTIAGDLVLTLYPNIAPKTVEQFLKLVRAGVYDTTAFVRVEPGFVAQLSAANDRTRPLSDDQQALVHRLPAEFSTKIRHVRGVLSMAREDDDPNSSETSFSILLGPAPHLDGKYIVFGSVEPGPGTDAVLAEILRVPRGPMFRPVVRIEVDRAEVISSAALKEATTTSTLAPARVVPIPADVLASTIATTTIGAAGRDVSVEVACGLAFVILIGLVSFFLQGRVPSSIHGSLNLVVVLVSAFVLVIVLFPQVQRHPWLAAAVFFGLVGLFKVLGRFERPYDPNSQSPGQTPNPPGKGIPRSAEERKNGGSF